MTEITNPHRLEISVAIRQSRREKVRHSVRHKAHRSLAWLIHAVCPDSCDPGIGLGVMELRRQSRARRRGEEYVSCLLSAKEFADRYPDHPHAAAIRRDMANPIGSDLKRKLARLRGQLALLRRIWSA